jgi:hypothetical protein
MLNALSPGAAAIRYLRQLRSGLQSRVHRFDSGRRLFSNPCCGR